MAKLNKFCPRCRKEIEKEFIQMLEHMNRDELMRILLGFRKELVDRGER